MPRPFVIPAPLPPMSALDKARAAYRLACELEEAEMAGFDVMSTLFGDALAVRIYCSESPTALRIEAA